MESVCLLRSLKRQGQFVVITYINILHYPRCSCTGLCEEIKCWRQVGAKGADTFSLDDRYLSPLCTICHLSTVFPLVFTFPGLKAAWLCLESTQPFIKSAHCFIFGSMLEVLYLTLYLHLPFHREHCPHLIYT